MQKFIVFCLMPIRAFFCGRLTPISTYMGNSFDPLKPSIKQVDIVDIAHGLAHQCRFNGQTRVYYSIAQHALMVAQIVYALSGGNAKAAYAALHHDDTEAYLGDVVKPLKSLLPAYVWIENRVAGIIEGALEVTFHDHKMIKKADMIALATERRDLMPNTKEKWSYLVGVEPLEAPITALSPEAAKALFLEQHFQLLVEIQRQAVSDRQQEIGFMPEAGLEAPYLPSLTKLGRETA